MPYRRSPRRRRLLLHGRSADEAASALEEEALAAEEPTEPAPPSPAAAPAEPDEIGPDLFAGWPGVATDEPLALTLRPPGDSKPEPLRVDVPLFFIGRGDACDLRLAHPDVSTRHALLQRVGRRVLFLDLGSRTGTYRNGRREAFGWLSPGDELRLGPYAVGRPGVPEATASAPPPERLFARLPNTRPDAGLAIRVVDHGGERKTLSLQRPITLVGRTRLCKLRLDDETVSPVHASLMLTPDGVLAVDLRSREGLFVNDRSVAQAVLRPGDRLRVGRRQLEVVQDGPAASVPSAAPRREPAAASDPFALALVEAVGDLYRQADEQTRRQTELVLRLTESVRPERRTRIAAELARLRDLAEEARAARREHLLSLARPGQGSGAAARLRRLEAEQRDGWDRLLQLAGEAADVRHAEG